MILSTLYRCNTFSLLGLRFYLLLALSQVSFICSLLILTLAHLIYFSFTFFLYSILPSIVHSILVVPFFLSIFFYSPLNNIDWPSLFLSLSSSHPFLHSLYHHFKYLSDLSVHASFVISVHCPKPE